MLIPDGFAQVNVRFGGSGAPTGAEVTFGVDVTGYPEDPAFLAQEIYESWAVTIAQQQANVVTIDEVLVKFGPNATGPAAVFGGSTPGSLNIDGIQPATAALVTKNTALGGRAGRGRMYIPGLGEGNVNQAGNFSVAYQDALQAEVNNFFEGLDTSLAPMVLLHAPGSPVTTPTPITSLTVQGKVATQRRRLRR